MKRPTVRLALLALALAAPAHADAIRLKASVRLAGDGADIRLADVADLEGPEATALGAVVVARLADPAAAQEIALPQVRSALDAAGAHWGRVNLSGGAVMVRPRRRTAAAPVAMTGAALAGSGPRSSPRETPAADDHVAARILDDGTLRAALARAIVRELGATPDAVRVIFDPADQARLDLTDARHRFEIHPEDRLTSDRAVVLVRVWSAGQITDQFRVTVRSLVRTATALLRRDVDRGDRVTASDLEVKTQWLEPTEARLACAPDEARDRVATRRLEAGSVLRQKHVRPPVLVERGERVMVRCLVGGIVISLQAEALADGAAGETIELRKLGERTTFAATVTAPGEAVVDLGR